MTDDPSWAKPDPKPEQQPEQQQPPLPWYPAAPPPPPSSMAWSGAHAKPGVIPLRPLGLGEILDGAISTMRAHPKVILGFSAIVVTLTQLIGLAATYPLLDDVQRAANLGPNATTDEVLSGLRSSLTVVGILVAVTLLARVLLSGFLTVAVGKAVLGQPVEFGEVWARVKPRLGALLGLTLIYPAVAIAAGAIIVVMAIVAGGFAVVLLIAAFILAIWLYIMFSLATPTLMLENASIGRAFGRSRELVRGSWWRMFGIQLLTASIAAVVSLIISVPFSIINGDFGSSVPEITVGYLAITTIGSIIAGTITEPFAAGVIVLLYTDQRMRREGMDIELARAAGIEPPHPA